jgi:hypothetical protein
MEWKMKRLFSIFSLAILPSIAFAQVKVIKAPTSYEFRDMGYDSATGQVGIVGYEVAGSTKTAKVFGINSTQNGFTATTLVGLGTGTQVFGISSNANRIAGISKSPTSTGAGEGTTWLRSAPSSPIGIGFISGLQMTSRAQAAWTDGVVGDCGGVDAACKWSTNLPLVALAGHESGLALAYDTNSNGSIQVGFSSHQVFDGVAYYWNSAGIHKLQDPFNIQSIAYAISPNGNYIGGYVAEDTAQNSYINAAVWDSNRNLILLKDSAGNRFEGGVLDVSDLGYAVGTTASGKGFIWHPSFDGVQSPYKGAQIFDTWLATIPGSNNTVLSPASKGVEAISEDKVNGKLLFALSDYEAPGTSYFVSATVAGVGSGGGEQPTHTGTTGNDNFNITVSSANQRVYVMGLGGNDVIKVTVNADNANIKVEAGTGIDNIELTANNRSNLKYTLLSGDEADTVKLTSTGGINIDANLDLGEGNDSFTLNLASVKTAIIGVKAQGGLDRVTSNISNSSAVVTAYDLGAGDDNLTNIVSSSDLSLAINGTLGNNTLSLTAMNTMLTQGSILGDGRNSITANNTVVNTSVIAYNFGYGSNTYMTTHTNSTNDQVTLIEPRLAAGVVNNFRVTASRSSNININHVSPNAANVTVMKIGSTNITHQKSTTLPAGVSSGTQIYNQIINTFNPYN